MAVADVFRETLQKSKTLLVQFPHISEPFEQPKRAQITFVTNFRSGKHPKNLLEKTRKKSSGYPMK